MLRPRPNHPLKRWANQFMHEFSAQVAMVVDLSPSVFTVSGKNIVEFGELDFIKLSEFFEGIESELTDKQNTIAKEPLKEIRRELDL